MGIHSINVSRYYLTMHLMHDLSHHLRKQTPFFLVSLTVEYIQRKETPAVTRNRRINDI